MNKQGFQRLVSALGVAAVLTLAGLAPATASGAATAESAANSRISTAATPVAFRLLPANSLMRSLILHVNLQDMGPSDLASVVHVRRQIGGHVLMVATAWRGTATGDIRLLKFPNSDAADAYYDRGYSYLQTSLTPYWASPIARYYDEDLETTQAAVYVIHQYGSRVVAEASNYHHGNHWFYSSDARPALKAMAQKSYAEYVAHPGWLR